MLAGMGFWNVMLALILIIGFCGTACFGFILLHYESQGETLHGPSWPRLFPWSEAAKLRRMKIKVDTEIERARLYEAMHTSTQRQMVYDDLLDARQQRALDKGDSS